MAVDEKPSWPRCPIEVDHRFLARVSESERKRCIQRQNDELEALESIFPGQIHYLNPTDLPQDTLSPPLHSFRVHLTSLHSSRSSGMLDLFVVLGELYPLEPPRLALADDDRTWEFVKTKRGEECLYDICQFLLNSLDNSGQGRDFGNSKSTSEGNLWDSFQRRQLCKEKELLREKTEQKQALAADEVRQKQKLKEDVADIKDSNPLLASPKIPTLDFLPADPDCSVAEQMSPFFIDLSSPRLCMSPLHHTQHTHTSSEPLNFIRAGSGSPISSALSRPSVTSPTKVRCRSAVSPHKRSPRKGRRVTKRSSFSDEDSDVSLRFKHSRGHEDSDLSGRFQSSSQSSITSRRTHHNFEMVEEEMSFSAIRQDRKTTIPTVQPSSYQPHSRYTEDFEEKHLLGAGAFGVVTKVRHLVDKQLYAIKRIGMSGSTTENNKILQEVAMFPRLFHRHVVRYYQAWIEHQAKQAYLFLQMEYCSGQSLLNAIQSGHLHTDHELVWRLFRQIVDAVHYLHNNDILHRDLKPANIFLDRERSDAKVGDFGLSRYQKQPEDETTEDASPRRKQSLDLDAIRKTGTLPKEASMLDMTSEVGTAMYNAPEVPTGSYDHKSDMWSLGIVFFEMFHSPFSTGMERISCILDLPHAGPPSDWSAPPNAVEILKRMVRLDPKERFSAYELRVSELVPAVMQSPDHDVIQRILMSLVNPMSTECGILLQAVSQRIESQAKRLAYTKDWFQPSFGNAAKRFISVCSTHQATNVELPILRLQSEGLDLPPMQPPQSPQLKSSDLSGAPTRFGLLDLQCNTAVCMRTSLIDSFRETSVCAADDHVNRWYIGSVYSRRRYDAFGHPTARPAGILGMWDRKVSSTTDRFRMYEENVRLHTKELLLATLEVLSGRRIELRMCWPWLLPVMLGLGPSREWLPKELRKGKKEAKDTVTAYLRDVAKGKPQLKSRVIQNAVELIQNESKDILHSLGGLPCVKEALEIVELVSPFVDKVIIDPLCEGLDEEYFEDFFFACRSSVNQLAKPTPVSCIGGRISNDTHVASVVQFCLKKLDHPDKEPIPRVLVAFHPNTASSKRSQNHLMQLAALLWRQAVPCEILPSCTTEQEIRQEIQALIKKNVQTKHNEARGKSKGFLLNFVPLLVCVKLSGQDDIVSYACRAINFKFDVQKVTKITIEREYLYDTMDCLIKALNRYLHAKG